MDMMDKQAEAIAALKEIFGEMCSSRQTLKPILTEIVKALEDNMFIDADADEVKGLLDLIVKIQTQLARVAELKSATASKSVTRLEAAINDLESKQTVNEMKMVLIRFNELACRSDDTTVLDAVKKFQRQAHKLFLRADKMPLGEFLAEGRKFRTIARQIESDSSVSPQAYVELQNVLADNGLFLYALMNHLLSLPKKQSTEKPAQSAEVPEDPEMQIKALEKMFKKTQKQFLASVEALLIKESDFTVESAEPKKQLSFKSFNNKLRSFIDGGEPDFYPMLKSFYSGRIFSFNNPDDFRGYNYHSGSQIVNDKLFQWGAADKVHWHGLSFYYLNDYGYEMLTKYLPLKDGKNSPRKMPRVGMTLCVRRFVFISMFNLLGIDKKTYQIDGDPSHFWIRSRIPKDGKLKVYMAMSLMMFDRNWSDQVLNFVTNVDEEIANDGCIRALLLVTTLDTTMVMPWFRLFKKMGVKNIFSVFIGAEEAEYFDVEGDRIGFDDMLGYLHGTEFDLFSSYKSKYIKKTRRGRKKANENGDAEPQKRKRSSRSKKVDDPSLKYEFEMPKDRQNSSALSLFAPAGNETAESVEGSVKPTVDQTVESNIEKPVEGSVEQTVEQTVESNIEKPVEGSVEQTVEQTVEEPIEFMLPTVVNGVFKLDDEFVKGLLHNAIILFGKGSVARGLLELHALDRVHEMRFVVSIEANDDTLDWLRDLAALASVTFDDPVLIALSQHVAILDVYGSVFERQAPFEGFDVKCLEDFVSVTFMIKESYLPTDMNNLYDLRNRQTEMLTNKDNAALKMCPSLKKLITLFKNFSEKTKSSFAASLHIDHAGAKAQFEEALQLLKAARGRADSVLRRSVKHPRAKGVIRQLYDTDGIMRRLLELDGVTVADIITFCRYFLENDQTILNAVGGISEDLFDEQLIGAYLDRMWDNIKVDLHKKEKFTGVERATQVNIMTKALTALFSYAFAKTQLDALGDGTPAPVEETMAILDSIIEEGNAKLNAADLNALGLSMLIAYIGRLKERIEGTLTPIFYRECLLGANYIELDEDGLPEFDDIGIAHHSFAYRLFDYERGMENLTFEEALKTAYETSVGSYDFGVFAQLEQSYDGQSHFSEEKLNQIRAAFNRVDRRLDILHQEFLNGLELYKHYARVIKPSDADYYVEAIGVAKAHFAETKNAGLFKRFIDTVKVFIVNCSKKFVAELRNRLSTIESEPERLLVERLIENGKLNVAEDIINNEDETVAFEVNGGFDDFLDSYEQIFNVCVKNRNEPLEKILSSLKRDLDDEQLKEFAEAWQNISSKTYAIPILLKHLSFEGATLEPIKKQSNNRLEFHATFEDVPNDLPFTLFNARLSTEGLDFVYMPYNVKLEQLIDDLSRLERRQCSMICLLNMALSIGERRKLAHMLKLRAELKNLIVVDRVLTVYLTAFDRSQRRERLLRAALPFSNVNPYVEDDTALFIDRERELEALRDINGATFLVGGRQLGKTALLDRMLKLDHKPSEGIYVLKPLDFDWEKLRAEVIGLLNSPEVKRVILLLDLNQKFASTSDNPDLESFIRLREEHAGRFKFIVTAHHGSVSGLDMVKLKPFTPSEAARFTLEPLSSIGMTVSDESVLRSIWVQANYCPGLLKYCCGKLVEAIKDSYELKIFEATKNPPYTLDDEFLQNMLRRHNMHVELKRRLIGTLHDEDDDLYYVFMLAVTYSLQDDKIRSVDLEQIKELLLLSDIEEPLNMSDEQMKMLLDEMVELKLLRRSAGRYKLYRSAFRYLFGSDGHRLETLLSECKDKGKTEASK